MQESLDTTTVAFDEDTGVGRVTLNRPDALNALSGQLRDDIIESLRLLEDQNDEEIALRVVVLEGAEGNFCAGADITEFDDAAAGASSSRDHYRFIRDFPAPVIAKIEGYCLGGGLETAMACDFRFADEDARLGLPEVDLGIIPGAGGVQYIAKLANPAAAKEIAMTGEHISASRAKELGIVNRVPDDVEETTQEFAETIASKPPLAIQAIKDSARMATQSTLEEGIEYDNTVFEPLLATEDHEEGARAFAEDDYEPEFKGR
ncbi:enoyl-CoA hydratase/isomerase family protein [Natronolimnohabitans innermongolicus]|uniref:Enoyl-CoA hydratase/isomerase n=1 Tax=Natronolimnohabitans innermongolicus JCM 12255 TaxID=1227499 RepID=L9WLZ2_9EURY|nr:enoyl-CoA hydratase/isomerase family protein [Natronolimnohabitans innermongolicus]ELY50402.1 enoyl-CoA hydratase/isomerase [Natronolimnohabitans innermongolicus JCM 12255]